jgi:2-dehydropantoate 2-reductase
MNNRHSQNSSSNLPDKLSLLCLGAGAIGTYIGGSLSANGNKVVFLEQPGIAEAIRITGFQIDTGTSMIRLKEPLVVATLQEALSLGPFDAGIIALKSFDTESVIRQFLPFQEFTPPILCLQNGVENETIIENLLGSGKVIPGTITSAIARQGPGMITVEKLRGAGIADTHPLSKRLFAEFTQSNLRPVLYRDAGSMKWSKLLTNLLSNATSAIVDMPPDEVFSHSGLFRLERAQLREALAVMKALAVNPIDLPRTPVKLLVFSIQRLPIRLAQWLLRRAVGRGRGLKMPSFHIDLHHGRGKSEVDYLNGAVARFGKSLGLATPVNAGLNAILIAMTEERLGIDTFSHSPEKLLEAIYSGSYRF